MRANPWLLLILLLLFVLHLADCLYLNIFTHSLPRGIYLKVDGIPKRGDYAATCITSTIVQYGIARGYLISGNCDTGTVLVLKIIKGVPGDLFAIKDRFFEINGYFYRIMDKDSSGRKLDVFYRDKKGIVEPNKYLLLSDHVVNSWDSRYWGPVNIEFLVKPLLVFDD